MIKRLSPNDIENLKLQALRSKDDTVTISKEDFEALIMNYEGYYFTSQGHLAREPRRT